MTVFRPPQVPNKVFWDREENLLNKKNKKIEKINGGEAKFLKKRRNSKQYRTVFPKNNRLMSPEEYFNCFREGQIFGEDVNQRLINKIFMVERQSLITFNEDKE